MAATASVLWCTGDCVWELRSDCGFLQVGKYWDGMVTGMFMAARSGHTACVEQLLAAGADPNKAARDGRVAGCTPLCVAAQHGHEAVVARLLAPGVGTDPNQARTTTGGAPLIMAAQNGHEAVVARLLAPGVGTDPNQASNEEWHGGRDRDEAWARRRCGATQVKT